jgi:hypothetical protein
MFRELMVVRQSRVEMVGVDEKLGSTEEAKRGLAA